MMLISGVSIKHQKGIRPQARGRTEDKELHGGSPVKTTNAMQLKTCINNKAREAGIPPQALMQNYLIERLLVRLSKSE